MERDGEPLAERFFSPRESAALRSLPSELRREAFFHCWTRKEAYIKANGKGLSLPLDQFDVTLRPGEPAALLATRHDPNEVRRWSMQNLLPAEGYVGAVGGRGACVAFVVRRLDRGDGITFGFTIATSRVAIRLRLPVSLRLLKGPWIGKVGFSDSSQHGTKMGISSTGLHVL